ncbi:hypothetical protein XSR1_50018 [Xenorhabdus szentirmaii DSM 16338]|uniref:Uncharacterized protein n=1 Tax=Xenorhabdus szentirmaii DSM 16338 TaxID=1427518 RepID=W1J571_9GAMM|nr:hypothetical protein XSR1_50018 [Xenorhabdus szentirmaii DSM 16338]
MTMVTKFHLKNTYDLHNILILFNKRNGLYIAFDGKLELNLFYFKFFAIF